MPRSNSELLLLAFLVLSGCSALQVEVPDDSVPMLRAAATGFLIPGAQENLWISRPVGDSSELRSNLPWIDPRSRLRLESETKEAVFESNVWENTGFGAAAMFWEFTGDGPFRLRGLLRWNASAPFCLTNPLWIDDSLDAPVEPGEPLRIDTSTLLADLPMRWPRLAGYDSTTQRALASHPDSLASLLEDWRNLNLQRKRSPQVKIGATLADTSKTWQELDTGSLRGILRNSLRAFVGVHVGDTLHPAVYSWNFLVFRLESRPSLPYFVSQRSVRWPREFQWIGSDFSSQYPATTDNRLVLRVPLPYALDSGSTQAIQIAGTCPSFVTWQRLGFSSRLSRPNGNLDPLDGYLCLLKPHRIDFPLAPATSYRHEY